MPPPPKSPTRLSGGTGARPVRPIGSSAPGERDVVDVVAGGLGVRARPGPSRSCGRRRAAGCARGTRRGRGRGAPSRRAGSPRSARRPARRGSRTVSTPSGCLRSTPTERRPRFEHVGRRASRGRRRRALPARSTRMTSAPMSASTMAQNGPGPMPAISMILRPARGPCRRCIMRVRWRRSGRRGDRAASLVMASTTCGQKTGGRSWPMPSSTSSSAPGIASAVRWPPDRVTSGSLSPWITSAGTRDRAEALGARRRGEDGEQLAGDARRVEAAVVGDLGRAPGRLLVEVGGAADGPADLDTLLRRSPRRGRRRAAGAAAPRPRARAGRRRGRRWST